jgi:cysteine synthase
MTNFLFLFSCSPDLYSPASSGGVVDEVIHVREEDAKSMARQLAREEGIFAGTFTGANIVETNSRWLRTVKRLLVIVCPTLVASDIWCAK